MARGFSLPTRASTERSRGAHPMRSARSPSEVEGRAPFEAGLTPSSSPKGEGSRAGVADYGAAARHPLLPPRWGSLADDILLVRFRPAGAAERLWSLGLAKDVPN